MTVTGKCNLTTGKELLGLGRLTVVDYMGNFVEVGDAKIGKCLEVHDILWVCLVLTRTFSVSAKVRQHCGGD